MKLGKKAIESLTIVLLLVSMTVTSLLQAGTAKSQTASIPTQRSATAGISSAMEIDNNLFEKASIEDMEVAKVTATQDGDGVLATSMEARELLEIKKRAVPPSPWDTRVIANVEGTLNVRDSASETGAIVGKMSKGNVGTIVENTGTWYKIQSGNVTGYVLGAYCLTGPQAQEYANAIGITYAVASTDGLRVRTAPDPNASIATTVNSNAQLKVNTAVAAVDGWVAVLYNGETGYISSSFVTITEILSTAITMDEYNAILKAAEEARKAEEAAKAAKAAAKAKAVSSVNKGAVSASVDDVTLLAALIFCEAGNQSYEGKLAVGAVVMNRVRSGRYPNSISAVIYQGGQFTPASSGRLASALSNGVSSSCRQAAEAAISGTDNVNGAMYFKRTSSGQSGIAIGGHVFY